MISCFGRLAALDPSPDPQRSSGPNSSHPVASAVTPPRQLAPTVGQAAALAGVFIRTGNLIGTSEHVVSGLVQRLGALRFVSDNAGCFGNRPFPSSGQFITFGDLEVYVGIVPMRRYHDSVQVAEDPPSVLAARRRPAAPSAHHAEVMVIVADSGGGRRTEEDGG